METLRFAYRPNPLWMALGAAFFAVCAAFLGHEAANNDRGLLLNGVIELSARGATVFYGCLAAASVAFVAAGVAGAVAGLVSPHHVTLTATELSVPRFAISRRPTVVALADVQGLEIQQVQQQRFLNVRHRGGKLAINRSFLPDAAAFDALCEAIAARVPR
jgi:hypothetical protein